MDTGNPQSAPRLAPLAVPRIWLGSAVIPCALRCCGQTLTTNAAHWTAQIDLGSVISIAKVEIYSATGPAGSFGSDVLMSIIDADGNAMWEGEVIEPTATGALTLDPGEGRKYNIALDPPVNGEHIKLQRKQRAKLCVAEIMVFSTRGAD